MAPPVAPDPWVAGGGGDGGAFPLAKAMTAAGGAEPEAAIEAVACRLGPRVSEVLGLPSHRKSEFDFSGQDCFSS